MENCEHKKLGEYFEKTKTAERESERFVEVKRAQLPIGRRQDTYLAVDVKDGARKFVKGPFETLEKAEKALIVQRFKAIATAGVGLPLQVHDLALLVPDGFATDGEHQAGAHKHLVYKAEGADMTPRWFHVAEDVTRGRELPMRMNTTKNEWLVEQPIIDWPRLEAEGFYGAIPYDKSYHRSLYAVDPEAGEQLMLHVLLDWVGGVGGDLANRNFLYDARTHEVWNVDIDCFGRYEWKLPRTQICSERTQKLAQFTQALRQRWASVGPKLARVQANLREDESWLDDVATGCHAEARFRVDQLTTLDGLMMHALTPEKRDESPKRKK